MHKYSKWPLKSLFLLFMMTGDWYSGWNEEGIGEEDDRKIEKKQEKEKRTVEEVN